jgi:hypothetical protein
MSEARLELVEGLCSHGLDDWHNLGEDGHICSGPARRVLSAPTEEMVSAGVEMLCAVGRGSTHESRAMRNAGNYAAVRVILTAAFNTLGIQETRHNPVDKRVTGPRQ